MKKLIITIDGPAGSGKERIAKYISRILKLKHLDSGIIYRKIALIFLVENIDIQNIYKIEKKLQEIKEISLRNTKKIRTEAISKIASKIAVYNSVRSFVNKLQYNFVKKNKKIRGFVIDGRDIGSVVFRKANLKLYIEVNSEIRAKRRYKQLIDSGEKSIYPKILKEIKLRDTKDKLRKNSPLVVPKGAHIIDNNGNFKNTARQIKSLLENL